MIHFECLQAAQLIQARAAGLSQANALRLEEHLMHCPNCSQHAHLLDGLRELSDASAVPLTQGARQRAVLQAFARVERSQPPVAAKAAWLVPSACGALLAAALVGWGINRQPELESDAHARVLSGELERTTRGDETAIETQTGGLVALAHAKVELRAHTRARWDAPVRALKLERGSVVADVDPTQHQTFRVETERFRVLVLGTRFEVSPAAVRVTRGRVRIESPAGMELAVLGAGDSYTCASAPCRPRPAQVATAAVERVNGQAREPEPPRSAGDGQSRGTAARASVPEGDHEGTAVAGRTRESNAALGEREAPASEGATRGAELVPRPAVDRRLDQAREALGRRDVARAREIVASVLRENLSRRDQAEALSLRAECALVAGDAAGAAAAYRLVAKRFATLPAGENALFASARIDAERLSGASAEAGLTRYLARYPRGRFVKEAEARLRELRSARQSP
jgi:ferric-dicitrate binding protein FerR (iron transport regulator)